ncbi:hypothetical protein D3C71_830390 [compost metagenome]
MLCRINPDTDNAAPTNAARSMRGKRSCSTMNVRLASWLDSTIRSTSNGDSMTLPSDSEPSMISAVTINAASNRHNVATLIRREKPLRRQVRTLSITTSTPGQQNEKRCAEQCRHHAHRDLLRQDQHPRQGIGQQQDNRAE